MTENKEQFMELLDFFKTHRKYMLAEKINKKRTIEYQAYPDKFVLRNKENSNIVTEVKRIHKNNIDETLQTYDKELKHIGKQLLDIKYSFLFDYKNISQYETYLNEKIEPNETKFDEIQEKKQYIMNLKEKNKKMLRKEIEDKKSNQKLLIESLKEYEDNESKQDTLREYIQNGKDIVDLIENYKEITEYEEEESPVLDVVDLE